MIKVLIYNPDTNQMETYELELNDRMPYANNMSVGEFRGASKSNIIWTDKRLLDAFQLLRNIYGRPIKIGYAFRRIGEGNHVMDSNYYAGIALDMAQNEDMETRDRIRALARNLNIFNYVLPKVLAPNLVHAEELISEPSCVGTRYPQLKRGDKGVYVLVLQDALNLLGKYNGMLDGVFGEKTENAVREYQRENGLIVDGIAGCNTWVSILGNIAPLQQGNT